MTEGFPASAAEWLVKIPPPLMPAAGSAGRGSPLNVRRSTSPKVVSTLNIPETFAPPLLATDQFGSKMRYSIRGDPAGPTVRAPESDTETAPATAMSAVLYETGKAGGRRATRKGNRLKATRVGGGTGGGGGVVCEMKRSESEKKRQCTQFVRTGIYKHSSIT
jgi:hypothetical protein